MTASLKPSAAEVVARVLLVLLLVPGLALADAPAPETPPAPAACCPVPACQPAAPARPKAPAPPPGPQRGACFQPKSLSASDRKAARIAWKYFERNYQANTGLVNAVDGYPSSTVWDLGSSLLGILGARELGFINQKELDDRVMGVLGALGSQRLFANELPNKAYNAATGAMTDYNNQPSEGIGYSALDIARMMSALRVLHCLHPKHRDVIQQIFRRWNYCKLVQDGQLVGMHVGADGKTHPGQEGRLGYEQYAGRVMQGLGFETERISRYDGPGVAETNIYGVPVRYDERTRAKTGAFNYVVTESYALDAMESGVRGKDRELLRNIFEVQKRRWQKTGQVTAVTEDHIDEAPWFVYNTIFVDGQPWKAITDWGQDAARNKSVSTKAAFSLAALFPEDDYSRVLMEKVGNAYDAERGWYSGVYERGGYNKSVTANTNGIILEVMLYKLYGPLNQLCERCSGPLRLSTETLEGEPLNNCGPGQPRPEPKPAPAPTASAVLPATQESTDAPKPAAPASDAPQAAANPVTTNPGAGGTGASGTDASGTGTGDTDASAKGAGGTDASGTGAEATPAVKPAPEDEDEGGMVGASAVPTGAVLVAPPPPQAAGLKLRLSGNLHAAYSPRGEFTGGAIASFSPWSYFFIRGGVSFAPLSPSGERFRYLWGIGYDDWHERTFTVQLNNWGPLTPDKGLDPLGAVLHVGYRLPRKCLGKVCGALYPFIDAPLRIGPAVGARLNLFFWERFYVSAGLSYYIPGITRAEALAARFHPTYGAGYRDWRPGTAFATFDNWGPSPSPSNAVMAIGLNWAL